MSMLHILNGDAFASAFTLPAETDRFAVFRSALFEGPIATNPFDPAVRPLRDQFYVSEYGADAETVARWTGDDQSVTETHHQSVTLWFEDDLYCAVNLIYLVARLRCEHLDLVFTHVPEQRLGTEVSASRLRELYDSRRQIGEKERRQAREGWAAYTSADTNDLTRAAATASWAPVRIMLERHMRRFPRITNGLDPIENAILESIADGQENLLSNVLSKTVIFGATDVTVIKLTQRLAAGPHPLVRIDASGPELRAELTADGASVLRGAADAIHLRGIDRWSGGIHLQGLGPMPRWDGERLVISF